MITIQARVKTCAIIRGYLQASGLGEICEFSEDAGASELTMRYDNRHKTYSAPIRLGALLDQINLYKNSAPALPAYIDFKNGCTLDLEHSSFTNKSGKQVTLTEKECEVLAFLSKSDGEIVSREELLRSVWNYAEGVETHTLETHIYRLRKKIEVNPSRPEILITQEDGYRV